MHCHMQQHSEFDKDSGISCVWRNSRHRTSNAENSCGKTQRLDLRRIVQKWPATEPMTLRRAQHRFWFPEWLFGNCYSALGWGSLESIGRGSFAAIKLNSNKCLQRLGSRLIAFTRNKKLSAWLLLNIHYFPCEKWPGWNQTYRTGGYGHGYMLLQTVL